MKLTECLIKKFIIDRLSPKSCTTQIFKDNGEYFLERYSTIYDAPTFMVMVQCFSILGIKIQVLVKDRDNFDRFTEGRDDVKEFILQHELGHIRLGHVKREMHLLTIHDRLNMEIEADAYAASKTSWELGDITLRSLDDFFETEYQARDLDIEQRLKAIGRMLETA